MPQIRDFRSDFRRGRTGGALRVRQDSNAYSSSVREANNMMVLGDGRLARRWGTQTLDNLADELRIIPWEFNDSALYLLALRPYGTTTFFSYYTYNESTRNLHSSSALYVDKALSQTSLSSGSSDLWLTTSNVDYLNFTKVGDRLLITDSTIRPQFIFRNTNGTLYQQHFAFDENDDGTKKAPFYEFEKTITFTPNIFTTGGLSTGYGSFLTALTSGTYDLTNGTGTLTSSAHFFTSDHVGQNMQLLDGEFRITAVNSQTEAAISIKKNIAAKLDSNPFLFKKDSKLVEVSYFNHGLEKGDQVFFAGVSTIDSNKVKTTMKKVVEAATDTTTAPANSDAGAYTVTRIIDADTFEVDGDGTAATNDELVGGTGVLCFRIGALKGLKEEAFSETRGWPTCACMHERRLWLGGTNSLPNAVWASQFGAEENFDLGEGNVADAIAMYGVGENSFVRHMVSGYDLILFTDTEEVYVPGSATDPITQSTVRIVRATDHGSSFTEPRKFDGGVFFVDANGKEIREFTTDTRITDYHSLPSSIVIPDWVDLPKKTATYEGASATLTTPYCFFADQSDGAMLVLHSARADDSFGWMRWTLDYGEFIDVCCMKNTIFAVGKRQANLASDGTKSGSDEYHILRFDSDVLDYMTTDFTEVKTADPATTSWTTTHIDGSRLQQIYYDSTTSHYNYGTVSVASNAFSTATALTNVTVGDQMSFNVDMHAPIAQLPSGTRIGKKQRLVSAEISFEKAASGSVSAMDVVTADDTGSDLGVIRIDDWREYYIGTWDRDPVLKIEGTSSGQMIMRGVVLNVFV